MTNNRMTPKVTGLLVWGLLTALTVLLYLIRPIPVYPSKALPLMWLFFSWNFYAYAFDKNMWPTTFIELDGYGRGKKGWRQFWFLIDVVIYVLLLSAIFIAS